LKPHVSRLVVCDPRKAALLKEANKSDRIDARTLAELLRTNQLKPVYHEEHGIRALKELGRSYLTITKDMTRVMNRIKALYRGWSIPCAGTQVYAPRYREEWLHKIEHAGVRRRAVPSRGGGDVRVGGGQDDAAGDEGHGGKSVRRYRGESFPLGAVAEAGAGALPPWAPEP